MAQANSMQASGSKLDNRRVLAALIDLAVVGAGGAVILAAAGVLGESPSEIGAPLLASIVGWALYYYFACESGGGQTLGKRAMKLRVVSEDGSPADMRAIGLRTVLRVIDMQLAGIVGLLVMNSTKERRARLGDLVGATKVVSAEGRAAGRPKPKPKATVAATPVSRVPIAESGPAFAAVPSPEAEQEAEVVELPSAEAEPEVVFEAPLAEAEPEPDMETDSLRELATDVSAVTADPDREVAEAPAAEDEAAEEPEAEGDEAEAGEAPTVEADALDADALDASAPEADGLDDDGLDDDLLDDDPLAGAEDDDADAEEELDPKAEEAAALEAHEAEVEGRVSVKSVQTVSAMDILMDEGGENGRSDSSDDR